MFIEIKGKLSVSDLHKVVDILSSYFSRHKVEEFVAVDIDLKPFSKTTQMPISLSNKKGRQIKSLKIVKLKSGELNLTETTANNTWMTFPLGSVAPGELMVRIWPLYIIGLFALILYLMWP